MLSMASEIGRNRSMCHCYVRITEDVNEDVDEREPAVEPERVVAPEAV